MAGAGRARLLQLSCRADQCASTGRVPAPCHRPLATHAAASQPKGSADVGTDDATGCRLAPETDRPPSLAKRSLCRHTPEVGEAMGRAAEVVAPSSSIRTDGGCPVVKINDLSRSLAAFDPISTLVVVVEMSKASWLVSGVVPGVERQPLKKLEPDAGKKITGRKRHILVDTLGLLLSVAVHPANIQDRDGVALVLDRRTRRLFPFIERIYGDGGYQGPKAAKAAAKTGCWTIEIVERSPAAVGFEVLPKRWIVERTFAWLSRFRRLARDFERYAKPSPPSSTSP